MTGQVYYLRKFDSLGDLYIISGVIYFIGYGRGRAPGPCFPGISSLITILEKKLRIWWMKIYLFRSPMTMSLYLSFVHLFICLYRSFREAYLEQTIILISEKQVWCCAYMDPDLPWVGEGGQQNETIRRVSLTCNLNRCDDHLPSPVG